MGCESWWPDWIINGGLSPPPSPLLVLLLRFEKKKKGFCNEAFNILTWLGGSLLLIILRLVGCPTKTTTSSRHQQVPGALMTCRARAVLCSAAAQHHSNLLLFAVTEREGSAAAVAMGRLSQCTLCVCVYIKNTKKRGEERGKEEKKTFILN